MTGACMHDVSTLGRHGLAETPGVARASRAVRRSGGRAPRQLLDVAGAHEPIGLDEVDSVAALQTRVDRKYLVTARQLVDLNDLLAARFRVMEIGGLRLLGYESVYYDTPSLQLFRDHRGERRRRCKVRVRTYLDDGARFIEVKTKGTRGQTVKDRIPHEGSPWLLTPRSREFVREVIRREYDMEAPGLVAVMESRYRRCTLVDPVGGERLTCDVDLMWRHRGAVGVGPDKILLETKTTGRGYVDNALARLGIRPLKMSKYAVGTALLHPELAANPWDRLLRREFGRHRA